MAIEEGKGMTKATPRQVQEYVKTSLLQTMWLQQGKFYVFMKLDIASVGMNFCNFEKLFFKSHFFLNYINKSLFEVSVGDWYFVISTV